MDCAMVLARFVSRSIQTVRRLDVRRFAANQEGVSAIEFALLLPLMLTLYISGVEISQAVGAYRKVTLISHSVADLVAQTSTPLSTTDVGNALSAAGAIATPYSTANMSVVVSQVCIDANGKATINWSQATPSNMARTVGNPITFATANGASLNTPGTCLIWGETTYAYAPALGYAITGTLNLYDNIFLSPRLKNCVVYTALTNNCQAYP
jgi:Flp pilus assembly protein TadG